MDDKSIMENILLTTKGVCDLYLHGAIESATPGVHAAFQSALTETLNIQDCVYKSMSDKGWYTAEQVPQQKINEVRQKFSSGVTA